MLPMGFLSCRSESLVLCARTEAVRSSPALISFLMCCHSVGFFCPRSYLYGAVSYRDAFDERRETTFCLSVVPSENLLAISHGPPFPTVELAFHASEQHNEATYTCTLTKSARVKLAGYCMAERTL